MRPVVFIPEYIHNAGCELLKNDFELVAPWMVGVTVMDIPQDDLAHRAPLYESDAVIVRTFTISADDLSRTDRLRAIVNHGVGVDNIDLKAAKSHGIPVAYTPTGNTNAVAEHVIALMMALTRRVIPARQALIEGRFADRNQYQGVEVAGKTLGIVGLGRIGHQLVNKAKGMGMSVMAYDAFVPREDFPENVAYMSSLEDLLRQADIISLHVPLTPDTNHLINEDTLRIMKPESRIINTSRGHVIDQKALYEALEKGIIAGAALDVFEEEPLSANHPLNSLHNTILTPHIGGLTESAMERISIQSAQAVIDIFNGKTPEFPVDEELGF